MNIREILAQRHISLSLWGKNMGLDNKKDKEALKCLGSGRYKGITKGRAKEIRKMLERDFPFLAEERERQWLET